MMKTMLLAAGAALVSMPAAASATIPLRAYLPVGSDLTPEMIAKGSGCWRIAFVVTDITYVNKPPYYCG